MSSTSSTAHVHAPTSADLLAFLPSGYDYRIRSCELIEKSVMFDSSIFPPCTVWFSFKGNTRAELSAWFEQLKVR